jgi:hypothetical protein
MQSISDTDATAGFIMFAFVKAYEDRFLSSFPQLVKLAYQEGLLLRYAFFLILLLAYSLFPYLFVLTSYFFFSSFRYQPGFLEPTNLSPQLIYLLNSISCLLLAVGIRYVFPSISRLTVAIGSAIYVLFASFAIIIFLGISQSLVAYIVIFSVIFYMPLVFFKKFDTSIKIMQVVVLVHFTALGTLAKGIAFNKIFQTIPVEQFEDKIWAKIWAISYPLIVSGIFYEFQANIYVQFIWNYLTVCVIAIVLLSSKNEITKLVQWITIVSVFVGIWAVVLLLLFDFQLPKEIAIILKVVLGMLVLSIFVYLLYNLPLILARLFLQWWFSRKYSYLFCQDIQIIYQAFVSESIVEGREVILQFVQNSSSDVTSKIETLSKMDKHEKEQKNVSLDILDELAKIRQVLRREQHQLELMTEVEPIAQDSFQHITSFDFIDPNVENNSIAAISSIESARQQLLNWLKGETLAKPSIDKLLIYQWQDYEIGIGLKYSGLMGGDFYDLFQLPVTNAENQFGIIIGDLTGHGVETALNISKTHNFWAETDLNQDVLTTMRAFEQHFKTTFYPFRKYEGCELCYLQLKNTEILLSNAGSHYMVIIGDNRCFSGTLAASPLENFGALGKWHSNPVKRYSRVGLEAGEMLIISTDGLYENNNQNREFYGKDNLRELLLQNHQADLNTLIETVFNDVYEFCQPESLDDDETLLIIRKMKL